jgi:LacI family transcriptional regulator
MDHLVGLGRRRFVHIAGPADNIDAQERVESVREAALRAGCDLEIVTGDFTEESGEAAIAGLLARSRTFDAVFGANDNMAIGALQALRAAGLRVPEDVAVAGFDDIPLARHVGLTTVSVRMAELGERAIAQLVDGLEAKRLEGGEASQDPQLIVRGSTQAGA